jgi:hypothetical protein
MTDCGRAWWLATLTPLREMGPFHAALVLGRNASTVLQWWKRLKITSRGKPTCVDWEQKLEALEAMVREGRSDGTIAKRFNVNKETITNQLKRYRMTRDQYWSARDVTEALKLPTLAEVAAALKCDEDAVLGIAARYKHQGIVHALARNAKKAKLEA